MNDSNDDNKNDAGGKKTITMNRPSLGQGTVRQDMGRGRSKAVVVETRKRRISRPGDEEKVVAPAPAATPVAATPAAPAAAAPAAPASALKLIAPAPYVLVLGARLAALQGAPWPCQVTYDLITEHCSSVAPGTPLPCGPPWSSTPARIWGSTMTRRSSLRSVRGGGSREFSYNISKLSHA